MSDSGRDSETRPRPPTTLGFLGRIAVTLFFVWFTGMCAYASMLWQDDQAEFDARALHADGVVVDEHFEVMSGGGGGVQSDPEVAFQTAEGVAIVFIDTSAIDLGVSIGDRVDVLYHPDQPDWARIDNGAQDANGIAITVLLGVLTLVSALGAFFAGRGVVRANRRRQEAAVFGAPTALPLP